jgi:hypothetical protein
MLSLDSHHTTLIRKNPKEQPKRPSCCVVGRCIKKVAILRILIGINIGTKYGFGKGVFVRTDLSSYNIGKSSKSSRSTMAMIDIGYKI